MKKDKHSTKKYSKNKQYTTRLQAGLGLIEETKILLDLWQPGINGMELYRQALNVGSFPGMSARRLQNVVTECFAPRFLTDKDYPANVLKQLSPVLTASEFRQLLFIFTARANKILLDFILLLYCQKYTSGYDNITHNDARDFVDQAIQQGLTVRPWSESTVKKVASYLSGCCADFGLLEQGRKSNRKILPFRIEPRVIAFLAYDLHFQNIGDNGLIAHEEWQLFGLQKEDVRDELKRLSKKGFFIIQTAGDVIHIGWQYKTWEELLNGIVTG